MHVAWLPPTTLGLRLKGIVAYTVMDDLAVRPMSSISNITLFNSFTVKDLVVLQEKTVEIG
jgi:hypothetical protein